MRPYVTGVFRLIGASVVEPGIVRCRLRSWDFKSDRSPDLARPGESMSRKYKADERQDMSVYRWLSGCPSKAKFESALEGPAWLIGELVSEKFDAKVIDSEVKVCLTVTLMVSADLQSAGASDVMVDLLSMREGWVCMFGRQMGLFGDGLFDEDASDAPVAVRSA